jgi:hypothetical protein
MLSPHAMEAKHTSPDAESFGTRSLGPDIDVAVRGEAVDRGKLVSGKRRLLERPHVSSS